MIRGPKFEVNAEPWDSYLSKCRSPWLSRIIHRSKTLKFHLDGSSRIFVNVWRCFRGIWNIVLFLFGNITARRSIAEREIKFYFIAGRIIARRAIKLLIMQLCNFISRWLRKKWRRWENSTMNSLIFVRNTLHIKKLCNDLSLLSSE